MTMTTENHTAVPAAPGGAAPDIRHGTRARFGVMLPSGNRVAEGQLAAMVPEDISLHVTRLRLTGSSVEELEAMSENVDEAASLVGDIEPALAGFHCTAVSTLSERLEKDILSRARRAARCEVVATSEAIVAALAAVSARRVVLIAPYVEHIIASEIDFLKRHGIAVTGAVGLGIYHAGEMAEVDPGRWYDLTLENRDDGADAYFISCTAVRSLEAVEPLEELLDKPVLTSNQVMAWHMLRKAGFEDRIGGFGRLLARH